MLGFDKGDPRNIWLIIAISLIVLGSVGGIKAYNQIKTVEEVRQKCLNTSKLDIVQHEDKLVYCGWYGFEGDQNRTERSP